MNYRNLFLRAMHDNSIIRLGTIIVFALALASVFVFCDFLTFVFDTLILLLRRNKIVIKTIFLDPISQQHNTLKSYLQNLMTINLNNSKFQNYRIKIAIRRSFAILGLFIVICW